MVVFRATTTPAPPIATDETLAFHTFSNYVQAVCAWTSDLYPHPDCLVAGVAAAVKAGTWRRTTMAGRTISARAGVILRNGWATEVLLNAPRTLGGGALVSFANLWAPVQAYYAVFNSFTAMAHVLSAAPPTTHVKVLNWAAAAAGQASMPFVSPWTARVGGAPGAWTHHDFGPAPLNLGISNLVTARAGTAPSLLALGLRTTRADQIEEKRQGWIAAQPPTRRGTRRRNLDHQVLIANANAMRPTTLFDLLWRLRVRSNYREGDDFLTGAMSEADAAAFHGALCDIVAATLLTVEIYLAHVVGVATLETCARRVPIPATLEADSVLGRVHLW
jgi:hypothetical protein